MRIQLQSIYWTFQQFWGETSRKTRLNQRRKFSTSPWGDLFGRGETLEIRTLLSATIDPTIIAEGSDADYLNSWTDFDSSDDSLTDTTPYEIQGSIGYNDVDYLKFELPAGGTADFDIEDVPLLWSSRTLMDSTSVISAGSPRLNEDGSISDGHLIIHDYHQGSDSSFTAWEGATASAEAIVGAGGNLSGGSVTATVSVMAISSKDFGASADALGEASFDIFVNYSGKFTTGESSSIQSASFQAASLQSARTAQAVTFSDDEVPPGFWSYGTVVQATGRVAAEAWGLLYPDATSPPPEATQKFSVTKKSTFGFIPDSISPVIGIFDTAGQIVSQSSSKLHFESAEGGIFYLAISHNGAFEGTSDESIEAHGSDYLRPYSVHMNLHAAPPTISVVSQYDELFENDLSAGGSALALSSGLLSQETSAVNISTEQFGPFLPGVDLNNQFDIYLEGDDLSNVDHVSWSFGGLSGNAVRAESGDNSHWQFTRNMANFTAGTRTLTIKAYDADDNLLATYDKGEVVHRGTVDYELQVKPSSGINPIDIEDARFLSGINTDVTFVGTLDGVANFYRDKIQIGFENDLLASLTFESVAPGTLKQTFTFHYDLSSYSEGEVDSKALIGGLPTDTRFGDELESTSIKDVPDWLSQASLHYNITTGNYEAIQTRLPALKKSIQPAHTGYAWVDEELQSKSSSVLLEGLLSIYAPLSKEVDPTVKVYQVKSEMTLLGESVWKKTYTTGGFSVEGNLDPETLNPHGLKISLTDPNDLETVTLLDRTFTYPLITVPGIIEDLVHANINLRFVIAADFGLSGAGFEINTVGETVKYVPSGTFVSFALNPSASITGSLDAKLFFVEVTNSLTGTVSLPINADLQFSGDFPGLPSVSGGSFNIGLDLTYQLDVSAVLAGQFKLIDYHSGTQHLAHIDLVQYPSSSTSNQNAPVPGFVSSSFGRMSTVPRAPDSAINQSVPADDHGNLPQTATVVGNKSVTAGTLETVGDVDLFRLPVQAGQTYFVEVRRNSLTDSLLTLVSYDEETVLDTRRDFVGNPDSARITITPQMSGDLFFAVSSGSPGLLGTYQLVVTVPDDHADLPDTATNISVGATAGNLEVANDVDFFAFMATAGQTYSLETILGTLPDSYLTLYAADGATILSQDDDSGDELASRITFTPTSSGKLYARVSGFDGSDRGTYQLVLTPLADPVDDFTNDPNSAIFQPFNSTIDGNLEKNTDRDLFKIYVLAGRTYTFDAEVLKLHDSTLTLLDSDGITPLDFNDDSGIGGTLGSHLVYTPTTSGIRYLKVESFQQASGGTYRLSLNSISPNTAPVLTPSGTAYLDSVSSGISAGLNPGTLVSTIISRMGPVGGIADADAGALKGIAINGLGGTSTGLWEFSIDGGTTWQAIGSTGNDDARLLAADSLTRIRYQPHAGFQGTARFSFVAWDQTYGTNGGIGITKYRAGESPYSLAYDYAKISVTNTAPVLNAAGSPTLDMVPQNRFAWQIPGTLVSDIIARMSPSGGITDSDSGAVQGIAINGLSGTANGTWEYTVNNGTNWAPIGTTGNTNARLLAADPNTRIRFTPNYGYQGEAKISFVAWDRTVGANGGVENVSARGGSTPFSLAYEYASVAVLNQAPVLVPSNSLSLDPINTSDSQPNSGVMVGYLINSIPSLTDENTGSIGIAINGVSSAAYGTWQYSRNSGREWFNIPATGNSNALLLSGNIDNWVRFVPNPGFKGVAKFAFVGWDQSAGQDGSLANVSTRGGSTPYSLAYDYVSITVT